MELSLQKLPGLGREIFSHNLGLSSGCNVTAANTVISSRNLTESK